MLIWLIVLVSFASGLVLGTLIGMHSYRLGLQLGEYLNREEP